jgi:hypothetical protein
VIDPDTVVWETEITRNGIWPTSWCWEVWRKQGYERDLRTGYAMTKDRARRKAAEARISMERDDVKWTEVVGP